MIRPWQTAEQLGENVGGVSDDTIRAWADNGVIPPGRRRGGRVLWKWSEVEKWLENGPPSATVSVTDLVKREREANARENQRRDFCRPLPEL